MELYSTNRERCYLPEAPARLNEIQPQRINRGWSQRRGGYR